MKRHPAAAEGRGEAGRPAAASRASKQAAHQLPMVCNVQLSNVVGGARFQEAAQLLDTLGADNSNALAFVREEQEYRAAASGDWLIAAKAVYQRALTAKVLHDEQL